MPGEPARTGNGRGSRAAFGRSEAPHVLAALASDVGGEGWSGGQPRTGNANRSASHAPRAAGRAVRFPQLQLPVDNRSLAG